MTQWLAMGGYGAYVWPAYAVFFIVLAWDWFAPALKRRRLTRALRSKLARGHARDARRAGAEVSA